MKVFENPATSSKSYQGFAAPEDILVDRDLDGHERRRLLEDWKLELELLATASEENMPDRKRPSGNNHHPEELLRRVNACRRLLSEEDN